MLVIIFGYFAINIGAVLFHPHVSYSSREIVLKYSELVGLGLVLFTFLVPALIVHYKYKENDNKT